MRNFADEPGQPFSYAWIWAKPDFDDCPMDKIILESVLTCPECGFSRRETMPEDACLYFYECASCNALLRPKHGDCCVFCSYGSVKCPPKQRHDECCGPAG